MMMLLLMVLASLAVAIALSLVLGRQGVYVAGTTLPIGAGIAVLGPVITSCGQCWTEMMSLAAFLSTPFFIVGWISLAQTEAYYVPRRLIYWLSGLMLVQTIWASHVTLFATFDGFCPCGAALLGFVSTELRADGFDRIAGPWFLVEGVVSLAILISIWRRARGPGPA